MLHTIEFFALHCLELGGASIAAFLLAIFSSNLILFFTDEAYDEEVSSTTSWLTLIWVAVGVAAVTLWGLSWSPSLVQLLECFAGYFFVAGTMLWTWARVRYGYSVASWILEKTWANHLHAEIQFGGE